MLADGEKLLDDIRRFVSEDNAKRFTALLAQAETLSNNLNRSVEQLQPAIASLPGTMQQLDVTLKQFDRFGKDVATLADSAQKTIDYLNSPAGPLTVATKSLEQLQRSAAQLQSATLPQINRMIENISQASRTFSGAAQSFEQTPQSLLFGPAPTQPGPGEPGFEGFR